MKDSVQDAISKLLGIDKSVHIVEVNNESITCYYFLLDEDGRFIKENGEPLRRVVVVHNSFLDVMVSEMLSKEG